MTPAAAAQHVEDRETGAVRQRVEELHGAIEVGGGGERCVCELQDELDAAQSRLSFHLKVLREAGLVSDRKEGRWSYYSIVPESLAEVHDLAVAMQPKPAARGALPVLRAGSCCG